jgi:nitrile hydratase accessory protein
LSEPDENQFAGHQSAGHQSPGHESFVQSPQLPRSQEGDPVFPEPWTAEVFAMTVHLHQRGVFTWPDWAEALSAQLHKTGRCDDGSDYFDCWSDALCDLLVRQGVLQRAEIGALQRSWQRAAEATPHGKPILLENDPQRPQE